MKIALFTPVNPVKSGISDYSEELLPALSRYFDIDLYMPPGLKPSSPALPLYCRILSFTPDTFTPEKYHRIVYHFGNSYAPHRYMYAALMRFPGIVVLHDYVMLGFYCEKFFQDKDFAAFSGLMNRYYPRKGIAIAGDLAARSPVPIWDTPEGIHFPMNEEIISQAQGLVVHSDFVRQQVLKKHHLPVAVIPHHGHQEKSFDDQRTRRELGIQKEDILLVSAGFINRNKRLHVSIPAVLELGDRRIHYLIIGKDESSVLKRILRKPKPGIRVRGYVTLPEMERFISAADICINLRYPTMGESSGSLLRMMGYQKPVLVSDTGSYRELPDYAVLKVPVDVYEKDMIQAFLRRLIGDRDLRLSLGREARAFVKSSGDTERCAGMYAEFIRQPS